jgi:hypothetical protein
LVGLLTEIETASYQTISIEVASKPAPFEKRKGCGTQGT